MENKKYLSLEGLREYDGLIKQRLKNHTHSYNDLTDKTHWVENGVGTKVLVDQAQYAGGEYASLYSTSDESELAPVIYVTLDGTKYECERWYYTEFFEEETYYGNGVIKGIDHYEDKPFLISCSKSGSYKISYDWNFVTDDTDTHTVTIEIPSETATTVIYHPLDERYIPDTIARKSDLSSIKVSKAEEATHAETADSATTAATATKASQDSEGNVITDTYETKEDAQAKYDELNGAKANVEHTHSYNDLTDRTHWVESNVSTEVLCTSEEYFPGDELYGTPIDINSTYRITLNGVAYECMPYILKEVVGISGDIYGLGNSEISSFGVSVDGSIDAPFCIEISEVRAGLGTTETTTEWCMYTDDTIESPYSITLEKIVGSGETIHYLDPKYIKDMYYTEGGGMAEILPECHPVYDESEEMFVITDTPTTMEPGQTITVTVNWNGTPYECQTYWTSMNSENDIVAFGNSEVLAGMLGITAEANECPFGIAALPGMSVWMFIPLDGSTEITVSVYGAGEVIHHLDPKYIKDMYYTEQIPVTGLPETTRENVSSPVQIPTALPITGGANYTVMWNGTPYECVATETSSGDYTYKYMGNGYLGRMYLGANAKDTGEPFFIFTALSANEGMTLIIFNDGSTTVTLSYEGVVNIIHKIDAKYLPEMPNTGVTYTLSKSGSTITLTGSDGSETSVTDSSTTYTLKSFGVNATSTELNYVDGVTSPIQTQLNEKPGKITDNLEYSEIFNDYANNVASGYYSHAEGYKTTASGETSHAEGYITTASGAYSHAEGVRTTASGSYSHSEGNGTTASGETSHAEGAYTTASGLWSHAEGYHTIASGKLQHVQGTYNVEDNANKYAHIVGNGDLDKRSNAHTLDWDGNAWYSGKIKMGGTSYDDASEVALKSDLDSHSHAWVVVSDTKPSSPCLWFNTAG